MDDSKLVSLNKEITASNGICIVALQEVTMREVDTIVDSVKINRPGYSVSSGTKNGGDFSLLTMMISPPTINPLDVVFFDTNIAAGSSLVKRNFASTKGYLTLTFNLEDGIEIAVVNVHLPFENSSVSDTAWKALGAHLNPYKTVICMGDFNTRSTIDDKCLESDDCSNVQFVKDLKTGVNTLQDNLNTCSQCRTVEFVKEPSKVDDLQGELNTCSKCAPLRKKLLRLDYLNQITGLSNNYSGDEDANESKSLVHTLGEPFTGFKEGHITFMPTYKLSPGGGFSLKKESENRLAGYADRILFKGNNFVFNSYESVDYKGNDHKPVRLILEFDPTPQFDPIPQLVPITPRGMQTSGTSGFTASKVIYGGRKTRSKKRKTRRLKGRRILTRQPHRG